MVDLHAADTELRSLLLEYQRRKDADPQADWHDRVMEAAGVEPARLIKLHGVLLANGWIETRVHREGFDTAGLVRRAYRLTAEGKRALLAHDEEPQEEGW